MTGPEHYREAELALADADTLYEASTGREHYSLAVAQVHATLAMCAELREAVWAVAAVIRGEQRP